jgi:hypothetical protein
MDMGARQEDDAWLDRPLPAGKALYARLRAGVGKSEKPERSLIDVRSARRRTRFR